MAQRRGTSRTRSSGATASKGSGEAAATPDPAEDAGEGPKGSGASDGASGSEGSKHPGKVKVRAGGFVTYADPVAPTPDPIIPCSVCGATLVDDRCPNGHGENKSGGWAIEDDEDD